MSSEKKQLSGTPRHAGQASEHLTTKNLQPKRLGVGADYHG